MSLRRLLHWGPITALSIILVLFVLSMLTILSWLPPDNLFGIIHFSIFMFWVMSILRNFFKASFIGPGHLPYRWKPKVEEDQDFLQYCESCQGFKAPRAHHCKNCKRCILKMDHHCPWINNCVGHYNHKSFILFLFFVVVGCTHAALMKIMCIIDHLIWLNGNILLRVHEDAIIPMTHLILLLLFFGVGLSIGVTIAVAILLYYQAKSIFRNETGIEAWIVEKAHSRKRDEGEEFVYPYDLGLFENIQQVMTWSHNYVGDGITWPVFDGCDQYTLTIEQLEQKQIKEDNMVTYQVKRSFNGAWVPMSFGWLVCWDSPWSEEPRMPVKIGEVIYASRIRKRWVYGEKDKRSKRENESIPLGESHRLKGWVPRCCVEELAEDGITLLRSSKEKTS